MNILINNAGFAIPGTIESTRIEDYDSIMATNVRGTFLLTQFAIPYLIESKGNIVNISSVCGLRTFPSLLAYSMSKSAVDHFSRCIAIDLAAKGVRCNTVCNNEIFRSVQDNVFIDVKTFIAIYIILIFAYINFRCR